MGILVFDNFDIFLKIFWFFLIYGENRRVRVLSSVFILINI